MRVGTKVAALVNIRGIGESDRFFPINRGLVGVVVETFPSPIVVVEFDMAQGIPGAAYAKPRRVRTYQDDLVEIR